MRCVVISALYLTACGKSFAESRIKKSVLQQDAITETKPNMSNSPPPVEQHAACALATAQSPPLSTRKVMTCTWKSTCQEGGSIPLGYDISPASIKITGQFDGKSYPGTYIEQTGYLAFAPGTCPQRGSTFLLQFDVVVPTNNHDASDTSTNSLTAIEFLPAKTSEKLILYADPCSPQESRVTSCEAGAPLVELDSEIPRCSDLNLDLGDNCPAGFEKCERQPAQACDNLPAKIIIPAIYLYCRSEPFEESLCGRPAN